MQTFRTLARSLVVIGLVTLLAGALAYVISTTRTRMYTATAAEYVTMGTGASATELTQGATYIQNQMSSFGQLATSPAVLDPVIADLGLPETPTNLAKSVAVSTPRDTVIIQIAVTYDSADAAATIANAISKQLSIAVDDVGPQLASGKSLVSLRSIQTALPPLQASAPHTRRNTALGLLIGLLVGCGLVLARDRLDSRIRSAHRLAGLTDVPVIGTVRRNAELSSTGIVVGRGAVEGVSEDLRQLRANLVQVSHGRPLAVVVTSSIRSEGRTTIAANLAAALGEAGSRSVLVDADLRRPHATVITSTESLPGLIQVCSGGAALDQALRRPDGHHFDVLAAGGSNADPVELLSSAPFQELIGGLRERYDYVVIDSPSILGLSDISLLHDLADGAVVVVHATKVTQAQVRSSLEAISSAGVRPIGMMVNEVKKRDLPGNVGSINQSKENSSKATSTPEW